MIVALTARHFRDLVRITGTDGVVGALERSLDVDFTTEADRFTHRDVLNALFRTWFANQPTERVAELLEESSVLAQRYRTFDEVVASGALAANPLFTDLDQPGVGDQERPPAAQPSPGGESPPFHHRRLDSRNWSGNWKLLDRSAIS